MGERKGGREISVRLHFFLNYKKNWQQFQAVDKLFPLCCKPKPEKTKTKIPRADGERVGGGIHAHTHIHTRGTHVKLCIPAGGAGPPAEEPDPTAGKLEAGKGPCVCGTFTVFGANEG